MGLKPIVTFIANGKDVSEALNSRLLSVTVTDVSGMESDALEITLSDNDPLKPIKVPERGAEIQVKIGYDGAVKDMGMFVYDECELSGWPGELTIRARGAIFSKSKSGLSELQTQKSRTWVDGTTIGGMVDSIAKEHSLVAKVSASLAPVKLNHIDQLDESDLNLLLKVAKKYDAMVKPIDGKLIMAKRGALTSITGKELTKIAITRTDLKSYRLTTNERENSGTVIASYHVKKKAYHTEVRYGNAEPVKRVKGSFKDYDEAYQAAKAEYERRERDRQSLSLSVIGSTSIMAEAPISISGVRDMINGDWLISRVSHRIDNSGYSCDIECEKQNSVESVKVSTYNVQNPRTSDGNGANFINIWE